MAGSAWLIVPDVAAVAVCAVAAAIDLRTYRIPNWLTVPAAAVGLALNMLVFSLHGGIGHGLSAGLVPALAGGAAALVVFFMLSAVGAFGMGDVKLMAAAGALLRWPLAPGLMVFVILAGGVLALAYAVGRGHLGAVAKNVLRISRGHRRDVELHRIPYGLAILAGCAAAVVARHIDGFPPLG